MSIIIILSLAIATYSAQFGQGSGPIVLNNVGCTGLEVRLVNCTSGIVRYCYRREDAGVICQMRAGKVYNHRFGLYLSIPIFLVFGRNVSTLVCILICLEKAMARRSTFRTNCQVCEEALLFKLWWQYTGEASVPLTVSEM